MMEMLFDADICTSINARAVASFPCEVDGIGTDGRLIDYFHVVT